MQGEKKSDAQKGRSAEPHQRILPFEARAKAADSLESTSLGLQATVELGIPINAQMSPNRCRGSEAPISLSLGYNPARNFELFSKIDG